MRGTLRRLGNNAKASIENLIQIKNGTFYLQHPNSEDKAAANPSPQLFRDLTFELPAKPLVQQGSENNTQQHWAVIGASGTTSFLEILRGAHICLPPTARSFPYLSSDEIEAKDHKLRSPSRAIQYVGFNAGKSQGLGGGIRGAYLSARYEARREETDWSVLQYLKGETDLNPAENQHMHGTDDSRLLAQVMKDLRLEKMSSMAVSNLSNGQTRRARIAKALLGRPELLLLDEPFMGLDPPTLVTLSPMLRDLAYKSSPRLILALRPQDPVPDWTTHLAILGANYTIALMGGKAEVLFALHRWADADSNPEEGFWGGRMAKEMTERYGQPLHEVGHTLTSTGIKKYETYEKIRSEHRPRYIGDTGLIAKKYLSKANRELQDRMVADYHQEWTLRQVLDITASFPVIPKSNAATETEDLRLSTKQLTVPNANQSSNPEDMEPPMLDISQSSHVGEPLIELSGVVVKYGSKVVLGHAPPQAGHSDSGIHLTIYQNTRLALLGPNGSGKTTMLSLLTSDHPHSYSLPIKFFGRSRLPEAGKPGLSLWDIQSRIGHSSPEIHAFFPKLMSIRRVLESAWAETYVGKPKLTAERDEIVNRTLRWWEPELRQNAPSDVTKNGRRNMGRGAYISKMGYDEHVEKTPLFQMIIQSYPRFSPSNSEVSVATDDGLEWAEDSRMHSFGVLPFGTQRLLLLLRAMIKSPDILILDEAFSGLSPDVRDKAMCFLEKGETTFLDWGTPDVTATKADSSQLIRTSNLRSTVELVFAHHGLKFDILNSGHRNHKKEGLLRHTRKELLEIAEAQAKRQSSASYKFTGFSDKQALVVVSHIREEVPGIVNEWLRLPGEEEVLEHGRGVETGRCDNGSIRTVEGWSKVWGL